MPQPHHPLFHNFHEAVQQGCFICITIWTSIGETSRTTWLNKGGGFWQAMSSILYQSEDTD
jgi:hypothetical protein